MIQQNTCPIAHRWTIKKKKLIELLYHRNRGRPSEKTLQFNYGETGLQVGPTGCCKHAACNVRIYIGDTANQSKDPNSKLYAHQVLLFARYTFA